MISKAKLGSTVVLALAGACAGRGATPLEYGVRQAPQASREGALEAAEAALVSSGYTIARRDFAEGVIVSDPVGVEPETSRSLRRQNPHRKIAQVRVRGSDETFKVFCRVVVQEQATQGYRLLGYASTADDIPGHETAIDRDAATSVEQNTLWRTVRRDKTDEREILERITAINP